MTSFTTPSNSITFKINYTNMIKGVAIILLMFNHFCVIKEWILIPNYICDFTVLGKNISAYIGAFGKICIAIWAFLSGIGAYYNYQKPHAYHKTIKKMINLCLIYWFILFTTYIPTIYLCNLKQYDLSFNNIIANMIACDADYNKAAWYLRFHIMFVLTFPLYKIILNKISNSFISYSTIFILLILLQYLPKTSTYICNISLSSLINEYCQYMQIIILGYLSAQYKILEAIGRFFLSFNKKYAVGMTILIIIIVMGIRSTTKNIFLGLPTNIDLFLIIPLLGTLFYIFMISPDKIKSLFEYLGKTSIVIWLFHWIFNLGSYHIQAIIYYPKVSYLVIILCLVINKVIKFFINKTPLNLIISL